MIDIPEYGVISEPPNLFDIGLDEDEEEKLSEDPKTCGVCGYIFKPGDFVHEIEIGRQVETVCDMCYHDVLRRERK